MILSISFSETSKTSDRLAGEHMSGKLSAQSSSAVLRLIFM